jgi:hypothetical protein
MVKCQRVEAGAFQTKKDKNGAAYYLHRLDGTAALPHAEPPLMAGGSTVERADSDDLHRVYAALLASLKLSTQHRENLHHRGLPDEEIDRRGYRSLPVQGRAHTAAKLRDQFGDIVLRVPGFVTKERDGRRYVTLAGAAGLVVPVRDGGGRIIAIKLRRDDVTGGSPRYSYMSSARDGGPGPGSPLHFPMGVPTTAEIWRVTEGELKADIATVLSGVPTIGIPGVSNWRGAVDALKQLGAKSARLAFDADATDKASVARPLATFAEALNNAGITATLERWPAEHKGIDDALVAGVVPVVLAGDDARQAIADTLAESTADEPPMETSALDRFTEVLESGGAIALFKDLDLLAALAKLAETDPAEYACIRARLKTAGVSLRDLEKALAPLRQELRRELRAASGMVSAGEYRIAAGRIVRVSMKPNGSVEEIPLCNFSARIVEQITVDDGAENRTLLGIDGMMADGTPLPRADILANDFQFMRWVVGAWGARAVVFAGANTADHVRTAMQLLSADLERRTLFGHTGWREVDGGWVYLHAGGAIGKDGPMKGVEVRLPDSLDKFVLPPPPDGAKLVEAIRASIAVFDVAPDRITVPLVGAVYRAVLGASDFSLFLVGQTGTGKTELTALAQQHFGAGLDARHLPGSWASTGNSLEALAFAAKDALLAADDFAPGGNAADVARMHREADRLLRAQGNRAGRGRCRVDGTLRPAKFPRGLILSTGEDVPRGQSVRARCLVIEISPQDLELSGLTTHQLAAARGKYAAAMSAYLKWLAPRFAGLTANLKDDTATLRDSVHTDGLHARTPGILADLAIGLKHFLEFAVEVGAINSNEREVLTQRCRLALKAAGAEQAAHVQAVEPCGQFLRLVSAVLASGRGHLASHNGGTPDNAEQCGWRLDAVDGRWESQGRRIGWVDHEGLFLEPEAAFAEAQELARHQGDSLPVTTRTLHKRLKERGLLVSSEAGKLTTRRILEGQRHVVIHLAPASLCGVEPGESGESGLPSGKLGDSSPCSSPDSNGKTLDQRERNGQKPHQKRASASFPPIPPVAGGRDDPDDRNNSVGPYADGY